MKNWITSLFFGIRDAAEFSKGVNTALAALPPEGIFTGDNLITYGRNLSFLDDERFMAAIHKHAETDIEKGIIWRTSVLAWAAHHASRLAGDFMECACYCGTSARIVCDYLGFANLDKRYYLYDLFEHDPAMQHHALAAHGGGLYDSVCHRFRDTPNVIVTRGLVPDVFREVSPNQVTFLHLDMNNAPAEVGALEALWDRIVPGGIVILDDYGWIDYREQKMAEDKFFSCRGYKVLELPTGQGLVVK